MSNRPSKSSSPGTHPKKIDGEAVHVVPHGDGWAVRKPGGAWENSIHRTQPQAVRAAEDSLRSRGGKLRIQGSNGRWRESFTIGRSNFAKISAVEGIRLSGEMEKHLRELDRQGLSPQDRLRTIMNKFGK
jgi:hypothetical protein